MSSQRKLVVAHAPYWHDGSALCYRTLLEYPLS